MIPAWLHALSVLSLLLGLACALGLAVDIARHPQPMPIMSIVWPITALFGSLLVVWQYAAHGRAATHPHHPSPGQQQTPFYAKVANGTLHCGSGCALGDIVAEWLIFAVPVIAVWLGYQSLFSHKIFAAWVADYAAAYAFGIVFQYFSIAPMRGLSPRAGLVAAIKADTLSLTAWQIGMYGFMAIAHFIIFGTLLGAPLRTNTAAFWFMMQLAMVCGFLTAYPMNWWLIRSGIKEAM